MEPVGIYSAISMTEKSFIALGKDHGDALIDDVRCILGIKPGLQTRLGGRGFVDPVSQYYHDETNHLTIQYDVETQSLFYFYALKLRNLEQMKQVPGYKSFSNVITGYKDLLGEDYIVFHPSAPNFVLEASHADYYRVKTGALVQVQYKDVSRGVLQHIDELSQKYYFDRADEYFNRLQNDEDVSDLEENAVKNGLHPLLFEKVNA